MNDKQLAICREAFNAYGGNVAEWEAFSAAWIACLEANERPMTEAEQMDKHGMVID